MIALVDPHSGGHHDVFLRMFVQTLQREGHEVAVLSPSAQSVVGSHESDRGAIWKEWHPEFSIPQSSGSSGSPWSETAKAIESLGRSLGQMPDFAFLASLDSYLGHWQSRMFVDRCFPVQFSGLFLHPWMFRVNMRYRWLRRFWFDPLEPLRAGKCSSVCVLDEVIAPAVAQKLTRPVIVFPDLSSMETPSHSSPIVSELVTRSKGRSILLLTGSVDGRKGIDRFLNLATCSDPNEWFFAVVGRVSWDTLPSVQKVKLMDWADSCENGWMSDSSEIEDDEFNGLIASAAAIWLAYEGFPFSSNLLSKSAAFRIPVLSNGEFLIGERVREYDLGMILGPEAADSGFSEAMSREISELRVSAQFRRGCERYGLVHSPAALEGAFREVLACSNYTPRSGASLAARLHQPAPGRSGVSIPEREEIR